MNRKLEVSRTARAAGSVMEVWPSSDYSDYVPKGSPQQRIGRSWENTGTYLKKAIRQYGQHPG